ncbi:MAG: FAD:protein FMN transferase [Myxococcota bacterium]
MSRALPRPLRRERFSLRAMGSPCEIQLYTPKRTDAERVARLCVKELERLEAKYSRYRTDSLASRINDSAGNEQGVEVDEETAALLNFAETAYRESEGRFDPTSGVLRRVWDFKSGRLPSPSALVEVCELVGWHKIVWNKPKFILPQPGMQLDFGGFVKEYAADRLAELCRENGVHSGMIDLGGDLAVIGPHPDGSPWWIGIRNPRSPSEAIARIALESGGLATSGDYERFMIVDGERYSHLLDPRTGESFRGGPACVSVTAPHCLVAGVSATIAMLHAETEAKGFLERVALPHLVVSSSGEISGSARAVSAADSGQSDTSPGRPLASGMRGKNDEVGFPALLP